MDDLKLTELASIEGYSDPMDLLQDVVTDSVCPAICTNADCDYTIEMEPDQDHGWCEVCASNSMKSALILAGVI